MRSVRDLLRRLRVLSAATDRHGRCGGGPTREGESSTHREMGAELAGRAPSRNQPPIAQANELQVIAETLARLCYQWPSTEIAKLIVNLKAILDARAAHNAEGGGVIDAISSRTHDDPR